jgi:hypothetical protein
MKRKIKKTHAAFPGLSSVPRYFHCSKASDSRTPAMAAKPIKNNFRRPTLSTKIMLASTDTVPVVTWEAAKVISHCPPDA